MSKQTRNPAGGKREGTKNRGQEEQVEKEGPTTVHEAVEAVSVLTHHPELAQMALQEKVWIFDVIITGRLYTCNRCNRTVST